MPTCPLCNCSSLTTTSLYLAHIRLSHADAPGFKICCGLQGCRRTFTNFTTFRNHIYSRHDFTREDDLGHSLEVEMEPGAHEDEFNGMDESLNCGDANSTETQTIGDDLFPEESQQRAAAIWILKAREQHRLPLSVMDAMIGDFQSLHQVAMTSCRQRVETALTAAGISEDIIASAMVHMTEESPFMNIFRGLRTQHQQLAYFRRHFGLVVSINS